ncbi:MAG: glycine rich domain-containing protein [Bacilli bacterium]|nr:glycine rich domain-containing protein [Bacilli bacterium]
MKKRRTRRILLLAIVLFISIGFAVLSSSTSINGLFNFTQNSWSIVFKNVVVDDTSVTKTAPTINQDEDTITFSAELNKPDDYYSFNVDVENDSTLDAMLGNITISGITSQYSDYLDCIVTYSNGVTPNPNDILYKTARVTFNIKLLYKDINTSQIPANTLSPTVSITINYRQANKNAVFVTDTNHWNFDYTGNSQTFTPIKTGNYKIELWGASGGKGKIGSSSTIDEIGGNGAYTNGKITLNKETNYYVYVGEKGLDNLGPSFVAGGWNGGGTGNVDVDNNDFAGSGGGATDFRLTSGSWDVFNSLKSRIMVAAGAGGGHTGYNEERNLPINKQGMNGGGLTVTGNLATSRVIWTPIVNQFAGNVFGKGFDGTNITDTIHAAAGGGGGYYGGINKKIFTNDAYSSSRAAGGSSFISGHAGCVAIVESSTEDNITFKTDSNSVACNSDTSATYNSLGYNTDPKCSIHYSNKVFTDTVMIDGSGYSWTTVKGDTVVGMPNKNGIGTVTGNTGNGFAKITLMN